MKNRPISDSSSSEESEEETRRPSKSNETPVNNHSSSSSDSSDDAPPPAPPIKKKSTPSPKKKVFATPLEKFLDENPHLKNIHLEDVASEDDDVCLLEVPSFIDTQQFQDKVINFERKTKLKINGTKYVVQPSTEELKPINLLTNRFQILRPISVLKMREYTKHKNKTEVIATEAEPPQLPDKLKVRHPLFGSDYKKKIELSEEVVQKLDEAIAKELKKTKKKKKRKVIEPALSPSKSETTQNDFNIEESISALLESHIAKKKKSKNVKEESSNESTDDAARKSKKKVIKEEQSRSDQNDTDKVKNKRKRRNTVNDNFQEELVTSILEEKRKRSLSVPRFSNHNEINDGYMSEAQGRKRKRSVKESIEKTNDDGYLSEAQDRKRKRKSSVKNEDTESESVEDSHKEKKKKSTDVSDLSESQGQRKRKKSIRDDVDSKNLIKDMLEETRKRTLSCPSTSEHKEKKTKSKNISDGNINESEEDIKPKKSKKNKIVNSTTIIPDVQLPLFDFDVSDVSKAEERPVKIKKEKNVDDGEENATKRKSLNASPKKKIKKEKTSEDDLTQSLIQNLLNKVKTELDTSPKKHKKSH